MTARRHALAPVLALAACGPTGPSRPTPAGPSPGTAAATTPPSTGTTTAPMPQEDTAMVITVNGHDFEVALADNSSARALAELVRQGDLQITMDDYGGFEKVGTLPRPLPTNDERITTRPGDVILYQGDKLTIYYDENTWSFTRVGSIVDVDAATLRQVLGKGSVTATLGRG